jgi:hypothetical protein
MALICPKCKTRNRSIAKFCIECITSLPTGCSDTDFAPTTLAAPKASRIGITGLITLLLIGSAGWLVAGAGGWYLYAEGSAQVDPARPKDVAKEVAPAKDAQEIQEVDRPVTAPAAAVVPSRVPVPTSSQGPQLRWNEAPRPKSPAPADPMAACSTLNFIAAAQCMAAQCLKPAFKSHAQCEAVRRRQQLEEEKRNPVAP